MMNRKMNNNLSALLLVITTLLMEAFLSSALFRDTKSNLL